MSGEHRRPAVAPFTPERLLSLNFRIAIFADIATGLGYAANGRANSVTLNLMQQYVPMQWWGMVLLGAGLLLLLGDFTEKVPFYVAGFIAATTCWLFYAVASNITFFNGTSATSGGPGIITSMAAVHLVGLLGIMGVRRAERTR